MLKWYPTEKGIPCERLKYMEQLEKLNDWLILANKPCERGLTALQPDCTLWSSIWKGKVRQRLPRLLKYIVQKFAKRRGRHPLWGRGLLPSGSHPLSNMGQGRVSARNPHHRPAQHPQNLRQHRALLRPVPVSMPKSIQRPNQHCISGKDSAS